MHLCSLKIVAPKGITAMNTALGLNLINFATLNMRLWYTDKHEIHYTVKNIRIDRRPYCKDLKR